MWFCKVSFDSNFKIKCKLFFHQLIFDDDCCICQTIWITLSSQINCIFQSKISILQEEEWCSCKHFQVLHGKMNLLLMEWNLCLQEEIYIQVSSAQIPSIWTFTKLRFLFQVLTCIFSVTFLKKIYQFLLITDIMLRIELLNNDDE